MVIVLDYNIDPVVRGAGSAIFLHLAHADLAPTSGCIGVSTETMRHLLPHLSRETVAEIR